MHLATASVAANLLPLSGIAQEIIYGPHTEIAQLHWNENFYGPSPAAIKAMQESALKSAYYPDLLIKKLIAMIAEQHGLGIENITVSAGSTQALSYLAQVKSRENPIATTQLGWDLHLSYAQNIGGVIVRVDNGDNLEINLADIETIANKNISSVSIVNPNNPTGLLINAGELRTSVIKMSKKALVIVDEAYNEITDEPEVNSMISLVKEGHNVAISRTFSKIYGLAGERVGYIIAQPDVIESIKKNGGSEFAVSLAGAAGALASYNDDEFLKYSKSKIIEAREMVNEAVQLNGLTALPSQTNFVFVNLGNIDADDFRDEMLKRKVLIRGKYGNFNNWSRVSMGNIEDVQRYVDAIPEVLNSLNNKVIT
ncbi:MAG TPA: histidinol-phosphate aminotransferase family protein [Gammaproteobacteria bacterium]|jgi:histidinol-phosphate aminotransferase|nr:histidinol-phosphate aminotransferase family protein [Gammaproteobacteria bacterium]HIK76474.1 histidinol-phosphate aminotransferase family protein [Gammaproteobacteria bacterium]